MSCFYYSFRNLRIASKNSIQCFSNSTKWVALGKSTLRFTGACTRSRINPSRSWGNDQVSNRCDDQRRCIDIRRAPQLSPGGLIESSSTPFGACRLGGLRVVLLGSIAMHSFQNSTGIAASRLLVLVVDGDFAIPTSSHKTQRGPCRRQRTHYGFRDTDGVAKPGVFSAPLRGLTTIPIPELWAAVVVMLLYAYIKAPHTPTRHRSTRLI